MRRRAFLGTLAGMGLAQTGRPNFLIVMADQHDPRVMRCAGDEVVRTPHLDALASGGVHFLSAYCQAPICVPARMSFLTGQQPSANRVWDNGDTLPSDTPTFAHALGAAGYETALIGRMHFTGPDTKHGFENLLVGNVSPVYPHVPQVLPPHLLVGAQGNSLRAVQLAGPGRTAYQVHDEEVTAATVSYLPEHAQTGQPFCAVAGFLVPHAPLICPKAEFDYYLERVKMPEVPAGYFESLHPALRVWRTARGVDKATNDEIRRARAGYYGLITQLDGMLGDKGHWWKQTFYDGSATVPLIVSCPSRFGSRRVKDVVSHIDISATLTELAGAERLPNATGRSLVGLLNGDAKGLPNEAFSELFANLGVPTGRMIRSGKWKLVHYEGHWPQLFDLEADPQEVRDLGESAEHAEIRKKLHARVLEGWSAAEIEATLARRRKNAALIRKWGQQVKPPTPELWRPKGDVNVFPEH